MGGFGDELRRRMERLNLSDSALSRASKKADLYVSRETIGAIKRGEGFQASTQARLQHLLAVLEGEAGLTMTTEELTEVELKGATAEYEFRIEGEPPITVIARGPLDRDELLEIIRHLRERDEHDS